MRVWISCLVVVMSAHLPAFAEPPKPTGDSVVASDAKLELHNIIKEKPEFSKIKVEVVQCDNITENQKRALVREHFSN